MNKSCSGLTNLVDDMYKYISIEDSLVKGIHVVGIGALIFNGLSYCLPECNITVLTQDKDADGWFSGIYRYIYIPNYDMSIGWSEDSCVPTPERAICDYLLYPEYLIRYEVYESIIFYADDDELGDFEEIVKTGQALGISEEDVRCLLDEAMDCMLREG